MENTSVELENFLLWFVQVEEIPMESRRDFLGHILKVGSLDEKAVHFIKETLEFLAQHSEKQAKELEKQFNILSALLSDEKNKESSIKEKVVRAAEKRMIQLALDFKEDFKAFELEKNTKAEVIEEESAEAEVGNLKAKLA
ncbi:hypothetical protein K9L27_01445 [Candidatus Gracilibacteria bacterium]|nr:hypothetical protein [Candidatus Gracilibacteria bacterium]